MLRSKTLYKRINHKIPARRVLPLSVTAATVEEAFHLIPESVAFKPFTGLY